MKFENHLIAGVTITIIYLVFYSRSLPINEFSILKWIIASLTIIIMAIISDIDHPISRPRKYFLILSFAAIIVLAYFHQVLPIIIIAIFCISVIISDHRTWTHSLWFGLLISLIIAVYSIPLAIFSYASYLSHLILDIKKKRKKRG